MKTFKIILWAIWVIAIFLDMWLAVYSSIQGEFIQAIYYLLRVAILTLIIKD